MYYILCTKYNAVDSANDAAVGMNDGGLTGLLHSFLVRHDGGTSICLPYFDRHSMTGGQVIQNRLYHVNDNYDYNSEDIDDQLNEDGTFAFIDDLELVNVKNNYSYDEIGQLVKDLQEEIETIVWRVDGKIKEIIRVSGSTMDNLQFEYDALGNRIAKHSYDNSNLWLKSTFYVRDAQGNVISVYNKEPDGVNINHEQIEKHIYGSSRLGMDVNVTEMIGAVTPTEEFDFNIGDKQYECSNHLGNVLAVISDKKYARDDNTDLVIDYYQPEVISSQDYSPFGVLLEDRNWSSDEYRYGLNGIEKDDEVSGNGNVYHTTFRVYDSRLGRWKSPDPAMWKFAGWSPYNFVMNNPITSTDPKGDDPPPSHGNSLGAPTLTQEIQAAKEEKGFVFNRYLYYESPSIGSIPDADRVIQRIGNDYFQVWYDPNDTYYKREHYENRADPGTEGQYVLQSGTTLTGSGTNLAEDGYTSSNDIFDVGIFKFGLHSAIQGDIQSKLDEGIYTGDVDAYTILGSGTTVAEVTVYYKPYLADRLNEIEASLIEYYGENYDASITFIFESSEEGSGFNMNELFEYSLSVEYETAIF